MKGWVYILKDEEGKFYVGSTSNLERRLVQHARGNTQTTRRMKNFSLVLSQEYSSIVDARRVEKKIKRLKRKDYIEKMVREGTIRLKP